MSDNPTMDPANYHGEAERHWGLVRSDGAPKSAAAVWVQGVGAARAAPLPPPTPAPGADPDRAPRSAPSLHAPALSAGAGTEPGTLLASPALALVASATFLAGLAVAALWAMRRGNCSLVTSR
ncbi:MAG: hypothetical protein LC624_12245 [Halobacteriales archaeon]|nr:hypothetical protein [Halobacteriales archaeon]